MKHSEFWLGQEFYCGDRRWRCTDLGTRVVIAICLEPHRVTRLKVDDNNADNYIESSKMSDDPHWFNGPPYKVAETVFDEYDIEGCAVNL